MEVSEECKQRGGERGKGGGGRERGEEEEKEVIFNGRRAIYIFFCSSASYWFYSWRTISNPRGSHGERSQKA